jgi:hypothetical protein
VGSLIIFSYKLGPLLLIFSSILIASIMPKFLLSSPSLSHALSCVNLAPSICSNILVDNKESFGESMVCIGSLLGVSIVYL